MDIERARRDLDEFGLSELYHLTHIDNLPSIAERGLLAKNALAPDDYVDISLESAQERREEKHVPLSPRRNGWAEVVKPLHDLVPFFVAPRNPMTSKLRDRSAELCWLVLDPRDLCDGGHEVAFTNGNMASSITRPYLLGVDSLEKMPWTVLRAKYWPDHENGSVRRSAELLVWPQIDWSLVTRIEVLTPDARARVLDVLSGIVAPTRVTTAPYNFFRSDD